MKVTVAEQTIDIDKDRFDNFINEVLEMLVERAFHYKVLGFSYESFFKQFKYSIDFISQYEEEVNINNDIEEQLKKIFLL